MSFLHSLSHSFYDEQPFFSSASATSLKKTKYHYQKHSDAVTISHLMPYLFSLLRIREYESLTTRHIMQGIQSSNFSDWPIVSIKL